MKSRTLFHDKQTLALQNVWKSNNFSIFSGITLGPTYNEQLVHENVLVVSSSHRY